MIKNKISRRDFIKISSLATVPLALGKVPLLGYDNGSSLFDIDNDRILVLINLAGGNDTLNTIYNHNQYANLAAVRDSIILPESSIIDLDNDYGFHPALTGLKELWENENLGVVQNLGYPNQNRSHFRSTDIYNTASDAETYLTTGWLGRLMDLYHPNFPNGYPNTEFPHPFAITMERGITATCEGINSNYSMAVGDIYNPGTAYDEIPMNSIEDCYGDKIKFVHHIANQTNSYAEIIQNSAEAGNNLSSKYEETGNTALGTKLKNIARLISGGLKTKIYVVEIKTFDTHDNQVETSDRSTGKHANLLLELSDAINAFQDDLELLGIDKRVVGMTYSEFGRRIRSNASNGTDHGTAGAQFLFGSCVKNQFLGDFPTISTDATIAEGIPMQYDFRNLYGTVMEEWLGAPVEAVRDVLSMDYSLMLIFKDGCIGSNSIFGQDKDSALMLNLYPNPCVNRLNIKFMGHSKHIRISIYDAGGFLINVLSNKYYSSNEQVLTVNLDSLSAGVYFVHIEMDSYNKTAKFIKI